VQVLPSTMPLTPGSYEVGDWVTRDGCDYVDTEFSVADLVDEARGDGDALINVTVEAIQQVIYVTAVSGRVLSVDPGNGYCYRVHGQVVRLLSGTASESSPEPSEGAPVAVTEPAEPAPPELPGFVTVRLADPGPYTGVTVACPDGSRATAGFSDGVAVVRGLPDGADCTAYAIGTNKPAPVPVHVGEDLTCARSPRLTCARTP
jgi:hypothetical protein